MPNSKNYDLDIDTTLGGSNASDYVIPSQKAIKAYVDNNSGGGGSSTDVQINSTSITSQGVANIITNSAYNASSNKIATMSDIPAQGANKDLSNLSATGENHFADTSLSNVNAVTSNLQFNDGLKFHSNYGDIGLDTSSSSSSEVLNITDIVLGAPNPNSTVTLQVNGNELINGTTNLINDSRISTNIARTSDIPSTSTFEQVANKVTSISSSSTDTQYPSAKLLYDQLALKQNTSTAVTHTANTAVGDSTTPVYIASNGTATSTGLSIANSRFDGQWVYSYSTLSTAASKGTHSISLSNYLPSNSYEYEVLLNVTGYNASNTCEGYISSDIFTIPTSDNYANYCIRINANSRMGANRFTIPVGTGRTLTWFVGTNAFSIASITAYGYRRIGTNT